MRIRNLVVVGLLAMPLLALAAEDPAVASLNQRLLVLQADMATADVAPFEKLQAQQAIAALAKAKRKELDDARYLAERRVAIAEAASRAALARREAGELERTRSELLIEASRRDAARARQEAEQLRVQTQIQAEEAERLRLAAEAETLARQDAETALTSVAGRQQQRLSAAQQNAAKLAREEAELVSGQKLPASRFEGRGEVYTFAGDAFAAGQAALSGGQGAGRVPEHRQEGPGCDRGLRQCQRRRSAARAGAQGRTGGRWCRGQPDPGDGQEGGRYPGPLGGSDYCPMTNLNG